MSFENSVKIETIIVSDPNSNIPFLRNEFSKIFVEPKWTRESVPTVWGLKF